MARPDGSVAYGQTTDGRSVLRDPKNVVMGADGRLYVAPNDSDGVMCLAPENGQVIWERPTPSTWPWQMVSITIRERRKLTTLGTQS